MSSRYTSNGKRRSSMTHARHPHYCDCGRVVFGNGGVTSHLRANNTHKELTTTQWNTRYGEQRVKLDR